MNSKEIKTLLDVAGGFFVGLILSLIIFFSVFSNNDGCKQGIVKERGLETVQIDSLDSVEKQFYTIQCKGFKKKIYSEKSFRMNSPIQEEWVQQSR